MRVPGITEEGQGWRAVVGVLGLVVAYRTLHGLTSNLVFNLGTLAVIGPGPSSLGALLASALPAALALVWASLRILQGRPGTRRRAAWAVAGAALLAAVSLVAHFGTILWNVGSPAQCVLASGLLLALCLNRSAGPRLLARRDAAPGPRVPAHVWVGGALLALAFLQVIVEPMRMGLAILGWSMTDPDAVLGTVSAEPTLAIGLHYVLLLTSQVLVLVMGLLLLLGRRRGAGLAAAGAVTAAVATMGMAFPAYRELEYDVSGGSWAVQALLSCDAAWLTVGAGLALRLWRRGTPPARAPLPDDEAQRAASPALSRQPGRVLLGAAIVLVCGLALCGSAMVLVDPSSVIWSDASPRPLRVVIAFTAAGSLVALAGVLQGWAGRYQGVRLIRMGSLVALAGSLSSVLTDLEDPVGWWLATVPLALWLPLLLLSAVPAGQQILAPGYREAEGAGRLPPCPAHLWLGALIAGYGLLEVLAQLSLLLVHPYLSPPGPAIGGLLAILGAGLLLLGGSLLLGGPPAHARPGLLWSLAALSAVHTVLVAAALLTPGGPDYLTLLAQQGGSSAAARVAISAALLAVILVVALRRGPPGPAGESATDRPE